VDDVAAGALVLLALRSGNQPLVDTETFQNLATIFDKRLWLADQIADILEDRAQRQPILIALDDFQYADPLSRFLMRALTGRLAGSSIIWAIARRGSQAEAAEEIAAGALDATVDVDHIALGPLADEDIFALAAEIVGHPLSAPARQQLRVATGNPLLASQLSRQIASGHLADADNAAIPGSLLISLQTRTRRLGGPARDLLHLAAVWGRPLTFTTAAEMLGLTSTQEVLDRARDAAALGLLNVDGDAVEFPHDLIREFCYGALSRSAKIDLHRRCAAFIMVATNGNAVRAAPHAEACARLGDAEAISILRTAAEQCLGTVPHAAAELALVAFALAKPHDPDWQDVGQACAEILLEAQHGAEALNIVDELLQPAVDPNRWAQLQVIAARALWLTGRLSELVDRVDTTLSLTGVSAELIARLTATKALALTRVESASVAEATAQRALQMDGGVDPAVALIGLQALGQAARNEGRYGLALDRFHSLRTRFGPQYVSSEIMTLQNLDRYSEAQSLLDAAFHGADSHSEAVLPDLLLAQQWQDWHLGHLDAAAATAHSLIRVSDELGNRANKIEALILLGIYAALQKQFEQGAALLSEASRDFAADNSAHPPEFALVRGYLCAAMGDPTTPVAVLAPMVREATQRHDHWPDPSRLTNAFRRLQEWPRLLAGAAMSGQQRALADQCVAQAELFARRNPAVQTLQGIAAQTRGIVEQDVRLLQDAAAILAEAPRVMLHARARADLGHALIRSRRRRQGVVELELALSLYERLGLPLYFDEVQAALEKAGQSVPRSARSVRPKFGWGALTDTERAVARHVAAGRTNRATAEALNISIHTVNTHLRSIFAKLDLHSRVQLANAWNARPIN
jgi:DNA-binding CsgD family transcriptional regulator